MGTVHRRNGWPHAPEAAPARAGAEHAPIDLGQLRWLRIAAVAEATTLLLLIGVAVPLKHLGDWPLAVRVLGPIHGFAFVAYLWLILQALGAGVVSRGAAIRLLLGAFVPAAGYVLARALTRNGSEPIAQGPRA